MWKHVEHLHVAEALPTCVLRGCPYSVLHVAAKLKILKNVVKQSDKKVVNEFVTHLKDFLMLNPWVVVDGSPIH